MIIKFLTAERRVEDGERNVKKRQIKSNTHT